VESDIETGCESESGGDASGSETEEASVYGMDSQEETCSDEEVEDDE
jgi:hypothetical protein